MLFLSVSALLGVSTRFALLFLLSISSLASRRSKRQTAPLAPKAARTSNVPCASRAEASVRCLSSLTKCAKPCALPSRFCFCFCSFFIFCFVLVAVQADEPDAPLGAAPRRNAEDVACRDPPLDPAWG
ncbi:hypothetical protein B1812_14765 [Methylocystis bryophila]|uniref:Uncharacterized protein n=1 Tax=Methylocystis bryophila TaxID=655015 RepID=A0A1W6MX12_9HYPH|nr:hypothetical protein B1812_14765 [Methylocystis bryophila]